MKTKCPCTCPALIGSIIVMTAGLTSAQKDSQHRPEDTIPLTNPGFEEGEIAVSGWKRGSRIDGVEYLWDRETAHHGNASLSIRKSANRFFPIAQWSQETPHTGKSNKLQISAFLKTKDVRKAILDVAFIGDDEQWSHQWASYIGEKKQGDGPSTHDWTEYTGVVKIPDGTKTIVVGLQMYGPGQVWFDDVTLEYVDSSTPPTLYDEEGNYRQ